MNHFKFFKFKKKNKRACFHNEIKKKNNTKHMFQLYLREIRCPR